MKKFTETQIQDFLVYEDVRQGGRWNMFDPSARIATGLSRERYFFVMKNYSDLKKQSDEESNAK